MIRFYYKSQGSSKHLTQRGTSICTDQ